MSPTKTFLFILFILDIVHFVLSMFTKSDKKLYFFIFSIDKLKEMFYYKIESCDTSQLKKEGS